ncbi:MAG: hypothetical protein KBC64_06930 [Simkaniaceae bacterium]|nr:hypothetical protein [Simkaniaceae bacterium]
MAGLDEFKDHFVLLCEAGFIAINQADEDAAIKLFKAAEILNPNSQLPRIGMGYLHFHKLELKRAAVIFGSVLEADPTNDMARTFLGMVLSLSPDMINEGEKILKEVAEKSQDGQVQNVASTTMDFVNHFVKKSGASQPAAKQPKK